jgi:hypothetical protein
VRGHRTDEDSQFFFSSAFNSVATPALDPSNVAAKAERIVLQRIRFEVLIPTGSILLFDRFLCGAFADTHFSQPIVCSQSLTHKQILVIIE